MWPGPSTMTWMPRSWALSASSALIEELLDCRPVGCVVGRAGPHAVAHGERDLVLEHDLAEVVELGIERVLLLVVEHPGRHERAAARDEPSVPALVLEPLHGLGVDPRVDGHEVRAGLGLLGRDPEEVVLAHVDDRTVAHGGLDEGLVERHGADGETRGFDHAPPDLDEVAAGRELHQGVGARELCLPGLLDLDVDVHEVGGGSDGGVHLGAETLADPAEPDVPVRRDGNDDVTARDAASYDLGVEPLLPCDLPDLLGDDPLLRVEHQTHRRAWEKIGDKGSFRRSRTKFRLSYRQANLFSLTKVRLISLGRGGMVKKGEIWRISGTRGSVRNDHAPFGPVEPDRGPRDLLPYRRVRPLGREGV